MNLSISSEPLINKKVHEKIGECTLNCNRKAKIV